MGEMYERYKAILEADEERQEEEKNKTAKEECMAKNEEKKISDIKEKKESNKKAFAKFTESVKEMLLSEALYSIYSGAIRDINEDSVNISENLVVSYIKENGVENIFIKMPKTYACETIQSLVDKYHKIIVEKADKDNRESMKVDKEDKMAFLDELDKEEDIENVKQNIAIRVSNAEEEFIANNLADKYDMDGIINDTSDRINAIKSDNSNDEETTEELENEAAFISKRKISDIREERPRTIFEHMVRLLSESVMKDQALTEAYCKDNNMIDIEKVVEATKCMYGFLETLNTLKLEKINEEYIEKIFDEL